MKKLWHKLRWRIAGFFKSPIFKRSANYIFWTLLAVIVGIVVFWAFTPDQAPDWTGFGKDDPSNPRAKTLWNWMQLLVVPIALAFIALYFSQKQRETELRIASEKSQEEILRSYFNQMSDLLLNHNLYKSGKNDDVRFLSRAITLNVLRQLDGNQKGIVLAFLASCDLIHCTMIGQYEINQAPIISLKDADLSNLEFSSVSGPLSPARVQKIFLGCTNLENANFWRADLSGAYLAGSWLERANFEGAVLSGANLSTAVFIDARLKDADLTAANLTNAAVFADQLKHAKSLDGCTMPNGERFDPKKPLRDQCKF